MWTSIQRHKREPMIFFLAAGSDSDVSSRGGYESGVPMAMRTWSGIRLSFATDSVTFTKAQDA